MIRAGDTLAGALNHRLMVCGAGCNSAEPDNSKQNQERKEETK